MGKLPTLESHMIQYGVLNFKFIKDQFFHKGFFLGPECLIIFWAQIATERRHAFLQTLNRTDLWFGGYCILKVGGGNSKPVLPEVIN